MLRLIVTMTLALAASAAFAQEREFGIVPNRANYELTLSDMIMPSSAAGTAIFKLCTSCETIAMPVNPSTLYEFGGQELALPEFLAAVEELRAATDGDAGVGLFYELDTHRVRRITVWPPR